MTQLKALCRRTLEGNRRESVRTGSGQTSHSAPVVTWAALAPLALPDLPVQIGRRLVEEHPLNPREFGFSWSSLVLELHDPDPAAAGSHVARAGL